MPSKPILIVDDDVQIRSHILQALQLEGYEVYEASNGVEALDFLTQKNHADKIGCILLDLMMPKMNGLQLIAVLQSQYSDTLGKIPVIIVTAQKYSDLSSEIPNTVAKLHKPMELQELYQAVAKHCQNF